MLAVAIWAFDYGIWDILLGYSNYCIRYRGHFLLPTLTLIIVLRHTDKAEGAFSIRKAGYQPFALQEPGGSPCVHPDSSYRPGCFLFATQLILSVNHHTSLQEPHFHTKVYFKFCVVLATLFFFTVLPTPVRNSCLPYICTVTRTNIHAREEMEHQRLTLSRTKVVHLSVTCALRVLYKGILSFTCM